MRNSTNIETVGELEKSVGYAYKIDIYSMATKSLMKRLAEDDDYTTDEAMFLYGIIKNYVIKNAYEVVFDCEKLDLIRIYDPTFLEDIKEVNTVFKDFIKELYNLTDEEYSDAKNRQHQNYYMPILIERKRSHNIDGKKIAERFPLLQTIYTRSYVNHGDLETFEKDYEMGTSNSLEKPYAIEPCE